MKSTDRRWQPLMALLVCAASTLQACCSVSLAWQHGATCHGAEAFKGLNHAFHSHGRIRCVYHGGILAAAPGAAKLSNTVCFSDCLFSRLWLEGSFTAGQQSSSGLWLQTSTGRAGSMLLVSHAKTKLIMPYHGLSVPRDP